MDTNDDLPSLSTLGLVESVNELALCHSHDKLFENAIALGRKKIKIDRLAIWNYEPAHNTISGTFGTDETGSLRDERHIRHLVDGKNTTDPEVWSKDLLDSLIVEARKKNIAACHCAEIPQKKAGNKKTGCLQRALALIPNGSTPFRFLLADNLLTRRKFKPADLALIQLYCSSIGILLGQLAAKEAILNERNLLQSVIDSIPDPLYVKDLNRRYMLVNNSKRRLFSFPPDEDLLGKTFDEVRPPEAAPLLPVIKNEEVRIIQEGLVLENLRLFSIQTDGKTRNYLDSKSPLRDASGNIIGLVCVSRDITELKEAQERSQREHELFRSIWDNSSDGMRLTDANGIILNVNPSFCRIFEVEAADVIGQPIGIVYDGTDPEVQQADYLERMKSPSAKKMMETQKTLRSGHTLDLEVSYSPFQLPSGQQLYLSAFRDITLRKKEEAHRIELEKKMLDAQRLESLGLMAGGIAHDFNNMLTGILGNTSLALMSLPPESQARENLARAENVCLQAADLCRQMLAYSGRGRFEVKSINLNKMIEDMNHLLGISINKHIVIKYHLNPLVPLLEVDIAQMRQVILNLVINASDAIGDKSGVISITTGIMHADASYLAGTRHSAGISEGDFIYMEVSDTGSGIESKNLPLIFDPFFTTKFTGRGLGLAAVLGIAQGHKGALKVYTEPGKGTTFKFLLPYRPSVPAEEIRKPAVTTVASRGSGTILIIDDDETIRTLSRRILESHGFTSIVAENGRVGIDLFKEQVGAIHLVLLDMTMPHLDGEETFREIRRICKHTPVVLMSGYSEKDATDRFSGKGLAGFLQKPFNPRELSSKILSVLKQGG
ncbi:MAG: PAS domain S-box protein [Methylacidiphilales bacterium]|nr:PAS domain S-box protein [Candidatus Methylacidiphilales bacterium]